VKKDARHKLAMSENVSTTLFPNNVSLETDVPDALSLVK